MKTKTKLSLATVKLFAMLTDGWARLLSEAKAVHVHTPQLKRCRKERALGKWPVSDFGTAVAKTTLLPERA